MPSRLPDAAATAVMLRASTRRSSSSRSAAANPAASPAAPTARPQLVLRSSRAASRPMISRSLLDSLADVRPAYLDHHPGAGQQSRRVDLGDGRGGDRLPVEAGELLVHLRSQLGPQHLLDRGPGNSGRVVLQAAQLADELGREKITPGGQHLPELDEGDPAVLHGQSDRAGQPGPALRRGQLRPASAPLVGQQPAPREDPADLPVAPGPAHPPSRGRAARRPARAPSRWAPAPRR